MTRQRRHTVGAAASGLRQRGFGGGNSAAAAGAAAAAIAITFASGCRGSFPAEDLDSPLAQHRVRSIGREADDPPDRIAEIVRDDPVRFQRLIEQLDHDDPVVRFTAIHRLERSTGETQGFRYDDPLPDRAAAVRRWLAWFGAMMSDEGTAGVATNE